MTTPEPPPASHLSSPPSTAPPSSPAPILEARNVSKRYGGVMALDDVTVGVAARATVGVVGESGSGKSTLARLLLALEPPAVGEVRYRGSLISGQRERDLRDFRKGVQIVFQDPMSSLDPRMRVHDILAEPLRALDIGGEKT